MTQFAIFAALLLAVTAAFLLPPLWRGRRSGGSRAERREANLAIFRDQLAELEREKTEGSLAESDYEQARQELQRRLLEEVEGATDGAQASDAPARKTAIALIVFLPMLALLGYGLLGNLRAIDPANTVAQKPMSAPDVEKMVARLAARLEANPDDEQGWVMLGRSYKMLGRYEEAVKAYTRGEKLIDTDPELLASYAETIGTANGGNLEGKPRQLIAKALKLDPNHGHSLFLAGAAAMQSGDKKQAIKYWETLLPQIEEGSELDHMLRDAISKMKSGQ